MFANVNLTPEQLAQMERCYRQWNGTSVMEGAFAELLAEVKRLQSARRNRMN